MLTVDSFFYMSTQTYFLESWECWQLTVFLQEYANIFFRKLSVLTVDSIFYKRTQTYFLKSWECWQYHICWQCWELSKSLECWQYHICWQCWECTISWECWELSKSWECWQLTVFFTRVLKYIFTKVESVESLDEYR